MDGPGLVGEDGRVVEEEFGFHAPIVSQGSDNGCLTAVELDRWFVAPNEGAGYRRRGVPRSFCSFNPFTVSIALATWVRLIGGVLVGMS